MSMNSRAVAVAAMTGCPRLTSAARRGWSDTDVARSRPEAKVAIEPRLAFALGVHFERRATSDDDKLKALLGATGRVVRFEEKDADQQEGAFRQALADPTVGLILQGVLPGLYGSYHRPDVMIRQPHGWRMCEVKVYLDRGGDTPPQMVQSAIAQTAVSIVAARRLGLTVDDEVALILADMRGNPTVRILSAAGEAELIEHLLTRAPRPQQPAKAPELAELDDHIYSADCEGTCALADVCRSEAAQDPDVLWPGLAVDTAVSQRELLDLVQTGTAPAAVQAGWDAATRAMS